eukprot:TRINITY_DN1517_c0_g1_i1.p1 TRINITY_DN1517_c0_g1~~TRINITY_DN1517_c0_g1_i1.p1  ORF type:complete len:804 (+),score=61.78 TRINITY_DN1517_c0_g1_i1:214-2625(+)
MTGGLSRSLSTLDGVAIVVSSIIGAGIFVSPNEVFQEAGSVAAGLLSWVIASLLASVSALVYAELGTLLPTAGGDYDYLTAAFGPSVGFAYLFSTTLVNKVASQAILAVAFAEYVSRVIVGRQYTVDTLDIGSLCPPTQPPSAHDLTVTPLFVTSLAVGSVMVVGLVCFASVEVGRRAMSCLTLAKFAVIIFLVGAAVVHVILAISQRAPLSASSDAISVVDNFTGPPKGHFFEGRVTLWTFARSLAAVLFAFDGWNLVSNIVEELERPERVPVIIAVSMSVVLVVYLSVNVAYLAILPHEFFASSSNATHLPGAHSSMQGRNISGATALNVAAQSTPRSFFPRGTFSEMSSDSLSSFRSPLLLHTSLSQSASSSAGLPLADAHNVSAPPAYPHGRSPPIALAATAAATSCSVWAVGTVACLVGIGILATLQSSLMTGARMIFAAARAGEAPAFLAAVTPWKTPVGSLLLTVGLTVALLLSPFGSDLGDLMSFFAAATWFFYGMQGFAVGILRRRHDTNVSNIGAGSYSRAVFSCHTEDVPLLAYTTTDDTPAVVSIQVPTVRASNELSFDRSTTDTSAGAIVHRGTPPLKAVTARVIADERSSLLRTIGGSSASMYGTGDAPASEASWPSGDVRSHLRPWRSPLYPLAPVLLVVMSFFLMTTLIVASPLPSLVSLLLVVVAVPLRVGVNWLIRIVPQRWRHVFCCLTHLENFEDPVDLDNVRDEQRLRSFARHSSVSLGVSLPSAPASGPWDGMSLSSAVSGMHHESSSLLGAALAEARRHGSERRRATSVGLTPDSAMHVR